MVEARRAPVTLKPIALTDDGSVILARRANARSGGFRLRVTEDLVALVEESRRLQAEEAARAADGDEPSVADRPRVDSKLTPREIQGLLRQGRSVSAIAKRAGVDPAWVERFEGPIVWERAGMAQRAQRATLVRTRMGPSGAPLGEAVAINLGRREIAPNGEGAGGWDAVRHPRRKTWIVTLEFERRKRASLARWEFDPETEEVTALSKLAGEIGWVPGRRRKR